MWFDFEPVELDFLEHAPRRWVAEAHVGAPRQAVWDAFLDAQGWARWFPGVSEASYPGGEPPYGVGTRRAATIRGQHWEETVLACEPGVRWAYRIDRATVPLAHAQVECTEFADEGGDTRLRWTLAARPRLLLHGAGVFMPRTLASLLERAARNLEREHALATHARIRTPYEPSP